jgi:2-polyprenyl-3-methyl-5-hydroxy-6-metoxy-1,4-benzoquinol methylase
LLSYNENGDIPFSYTGYNSVNIVDNCGSFENKSIVEFVYDLEHEKFIPIRPRPDKTKGNFIDIAKDNFKNIVNAFDFEILNPNPIKKRQDTYFFNTRRFHNWIKYKYINKYCNKTHILLDLSCGKGGDIHKWISCNIKSVEGYDICDDSIQEAKKRFISVASNATTKNFDFEFYKKDLSKDVVVTSKAFDNITCFFAIHYFFKDSDTIYNFMKNTSNLKIGGHFLITLFDAESIIDLGTEIKGDHFTIESCHDNNDKINVWIKDTVLSSKTEEYLVKSKQLIDTLSKYGFQLVEHQFFETFYKDWKKNKNYLNNDQKLLSYLNKIYVFKKIKQIDITQDITQDIAENISKMIVSEPVKENEHGKDTRESLEKLKVTDLREKCKELKVSQSGLKKDLIIRILQTKK